MIFITPFLKSNINNRCPQGQHPLFPSKKILGTHLVKGLELKYAQCS